MGLYSWTSRDPRLIYCAVREHRNGEQVGTGEAVSMAASYNAGDAVMEKTDAAGGRLRWQN